MCTLTAFPLDDGTVRLAFNRDESRQRPAGLAPALRTSGRRQVLMPIDPQGGGTWIGVNDAGMAATLMNVYAGAADSRMRRPGLASRGEIVPALLSRGDLQGARDAALALDPGRYPPFRVFLCHDGECLDVVSDGREMSPGEIAPLREPLLRTTSGLGDDRVEPPRRVLFESFLQEGDPCFAQDAFHRHSWADRPEVSVCMRRAAAATVSFSVVEIEPDRALATFFYHPAPPDEHAFKEVALLELAP